MSVSVPARPGAPVVSFPARCAVAVICDDQLISQVYPAAVPIEVFLDDAVELLGIELKRRGRPGLPGGRRYELLRVNGSRLDIGRSLEELGVDDGSALLLVPASPGDSYEPQYESLSTGLARIGRTMFPPMTPQTAAHTALVILATAAAVLIAAALRTRLSADTPIPAVVTGGSGLLVAGLAVAVWRWWPRRTDLLDGFGWLGAGLLAVAAAMVAPGGLGAPHVFIGMLAAAVLTITLSTVTGRQVPVAAATVALCVLAGTVSAARMWRPVPAQWLGMGALIAVLVLLTVAPAIALRTAHIRPPHFGSVTGRDLFHRADGMPVDAVVPVQPESTEADPNPDTTPRGAQIAAAARRANAVLTGLCAASAVALVPAVWATLTPGRPKADAAALLAGLLVLVVLLRSRNFADKRQSVALLCGAAAAVSAGVSRYLWSAPPEDGGALLAGTAALVGFGGAALIAALLVPPTRFTPLVRMTAEWLELLAIVVALPLAAWVGGLFAWVRMR